MTGAGARAKYKYVYTREKHPETGKYYPKRGPMTLEYASKIVFNHQIGTNNKWLNFIKNNEELKKKRAELAQLMKNLSAEYKKTLTPEERARLESRKKPRSKRSRLAEAQARIAQFKQKYPDPVASLRTIVSYMPNVRSARIFLRAVYGLTKKEAKRLLPPRQKYKPKSFGEYKEEEAPKKEEVAPKEEEVIAPKEEEKPAPPPPTQPKKKPPPRT
jgi:hypothetical protein